MRVGPVTRRPGKGAVVSRWGLKMPTPAVFTGLVEPHLRSSGWGSALRPGGPAAPQVPDSRGSASTVTKGCWGWDSVPLPWATPALT